MQQDEATASVPAEFEPIVAVFDTISVARRAIDALVQADFHDIWLAIVRGETDAGETLVSHDDNDPIVLRRVLADRGSREEHARCFDGILPPGTAVMSLRVRTKFDDAVDIIQITGGHVEHF